MACLSFCLILGCGGGGDQPELHAVTGKVTNGGQPVAKMRVTFTPDQGGRPASGETGDDGSYTLVYNDGIEGTTAGTHTVRLLFVEAETEDYESGNDEEENTTDLKGIPKSAFDGTMKKEVKAGANEINIEL